MTTPATPNVLAQRYASPEMVAIWSAENKIIAERRLWLAVLRAQRDLGLDGAGRGVRRLRGGHRRREPGLDRRPRAGHPARRQGADRGVQRAGRVRADPQGHDQPGPHREHRAGADLRLAPAGPRPHGGRAGRAGPPGRRVRRPGDGRPLAQRPGAGHHPGQALRLRGRRGAPGLPTDLGSAGAVSVARHQGTGRHVAGHARPAGLGRGRRLRWKPLSRRRSPGSDTAADQRRSGVSAVAGLRGGLGAGATGGGSRVAGHHHQVDGRCRTGHRGLPAGPGGFVRHAAQDECPVLRTGVRPRGDPARATPR